MRFLLTLPLYLLSFAQQQFGQSPLSTSYQNLQSQQPVSFNINGMDNTYQLGSNLLPSNYPNTVSYNNIQILKLKDNIRNINGQYNNLQHPKWGGSFIPLQRAHQHNYKDNDHQPHDTLPNPRTISNVVGAQSYPFPKNKDNLTILFTIWAQFMDHDITLSTAQDQPNPQLFNIPIPKGDKFLDPNGQGGKSIRFRRSKFIPDKYPRTLINQLTAWVDGSQVYGSTDQIAKQLRSFQKGKLLTSQNNLLPKDNKNFFLAGDSRANQNLALTAIHTLFVRQHNRLANIIYKISPTSTDQEIYQTARHYVIGLIQKITYEDFLPSLIGPISYGKYLGKNKPYNSNLNPNIQTQFSTAAFRIGHPILIDKFFRFDQFGVNKGQFKLSEMFFRPDLYQDSTLLDHIIRGLTKTLAKQRDNTLVDQVRNFLIPGQNDRATKIDLYSLNIQRSRDHGVLSYGKIRQKQGLGKVDNFLQFAIDNTVAQKLSSVYNSPQQCDLWVGIISEKKQTGAVMGLLGSKIVGEAFARIRDGDRFWYQRTYPDSIISQIKRTTLGDIIQRNTGIKNLQFDVFRII